VHGHCHQKSFGAFTSVGQVLRLIPDLNVEIIESSCCGMAGAFGYGADTFDVSMEIAELSLLPAVRRADAQTLIVADGTSCRHQIKDGADRGAVHVARVLAMSLARAIQFKQPSSHKGTIPWLISPSTLRARFSMWLSPRALRRN
jgi:Fe-S oxidoreductase